MPLPKPKKNEKHDDFMSRCMANETMLTEYPDQKQRYAVCESQWEDKDKKKSAPVREVRIVPAGQVELRIVREDGKPSKLEGYAAVFDKLSVDLGFFAPIYEKIAPGAFKNCLKGTDTRCLFNHDANFILGRTKSGTLRLHEDRKGLHFSNDLPDTQQARDVAASIERGDIDGCSFAFTVKADEWRKGDEDEPDIRTLIEIDELFDVGPVVYPAYSDTSVAARSYQEWRKASGSIEVPAETPEGEVKAEAQPEIKPEPKPEAKAEVKADPSTPNQSELNRQQLEAARAETKRLSLLYIKLEYDRRH